MTGAIDQGAPDWQAIAGALALGLGRGAPPPAPGLGLDGLGEGPRALALLALLGQRRRLATPVGRIVETTARAWPDDPRPMAPPPVREALGRLDRRLDAESRRLLAPVILGALAAHGHRPHLFDLAHLEPLLRHAAEGLGPVERAWLDAGRPTAAPASDPAGEDDADGKGPARTPTEFRALRRADPAAAREGLAGMLAGLPAKARSEWVAALDVGLSAADRPLLEGLATDRARAVREAADALLARLPGSQAHEARLAAARRCLGVETAGLLTKRPRLLFRPPPGPEEGAAKTLMTLFEGFGLGDLLHGLAITPEALPAAASGAQALLRPLARAALHDGDVGAATGLLGRLADPVWPGDLVGLPFDPARLDTGARRAAAEGAFSASVTLGQGPGFLALLRWLDGPLEESFARRLMASRPWTARLAEIDERRAADPKADADAALLPMIAVMPPAAAEALIAQMEPIPPAARPRTTALLAYFRELARLAPQATPLSPSPGD